MRSDSVLAGNQKMKSNTVAKFAYRRQMDVPARAIIVACEGNVSVRLGDGRILTTPTCMNKGMLNRKIW